MFNISAIPIQFVETFIWKKALHSGYINLH